MQTGTAVRHKVSHTGISEASHTHPPPCANRAGTRVAILSFKNRFFRGNGHDSKRPPSIQDAIVTPFSCKITLEDTIWGLIPPDPRYDRCRIDAAAPRGHSRGGFKSLFFRKPTLPRRAKKGPDAGSPPTIPYFQGFHGLGVSPHSCCLFLPGITVR